MKLDNATVLITGANRGLGLAFAREVLADHITRQVHQGLSGNPAVCMQALVR